MDEAARVSVEERVRGGERLRVGECVRNLSEQSSNERMRRLLSYDVWRLKV